VHDHNVYWDLTPRTIVNFDYVLMFVKLLVLCVHMYRVALMLIKVLFIIRPIFDIPKGGWASVLFHNTVQCIKQVRYHPHNHTSHSIQDIIHHSNHVP
jgi:hypothetical protein